MRMHSADYAVERCLSVCLSHAGIESKRLHILTVFTPSGSSTILVFQHQTEWQYSDGDPLTGASNARGGVCKKSRFSTNVSLYLVNDARAIITMEGE